MQEKTENILSISERIIQFLNYLKVSRYKFSQQTGVSESVLLNLYKAKNKPSIEILKKILNKYPSLNLNWLLTGTGQMVIEKSDPGNQTSLECGNKECWSCKQKDETIGILKMLIDNQNKTIEVLYARINEVKPEHGQKRKAG